MLWLFFLIFSEKYTGLRAVFSSISGKLSNCRLTDTFSPSTARFECGNRPSLDYVLGVFFFFFLKIFIIRPVTQCHNCRKHSWPNPNRSGLVAIYRASWELHRLLFMWIFLCQHHSMNQRTPVVVQKPGFLLPFFFSSKVPGLVSLQNKHDRFPTRLSERQQKLHIRCAARLQSTRKETVVLKVASAQ